MVSVASQKKIASETISREPSAGSLGVSDDAKALTERRRLKKTREWALESPAGKRGCGGPGLMYLTVRGCHAACGLMACGVSALIGESGKPGAPVWR